MKIRKSRIIGGYQNTKLNNEDQCLMKLSRLRKRNGNSIKNRIMKSLNSVLIGTILFIITCGLMINNNTIIGILFLIISIFFIIKGCINTKN